MREVFGKYGLLLQEEAPVKNGDGAVRTSRRLGFPVLLTSLFLENQKNRGTTLNSGRGPSDIRAISDVICGASRLGLENDAILKIDINPLFVYEKGAVVV